MSLLAMIAPLAAAVADDIIIDTDDDTDLKATTNTQQSQSQQQNLVKVSSNSLRKINKTKFRMQLFAFLNQPIVEVMAALAVLLSSLLVAISTLQDLPTTTEYAITQALITLDVFFAIDFFMRWYTAGQFKVRYLTKPLALVDIVVVILPLFIGTIMPLVNFITSNINDISGEQLISLSQYSPIHDSAGLQNLLLLRVLRLRRVLTDISTFGRFTAALGIGTLNNAQLNTVVKPYQLQLARVGLSIFTLLSVASGLIYSAEHNVNPDIPDYFTALYFGLTTLTTVGKLSMF